MKDLLGLQNIKKETLDVILNEGAAMKKLLASGVKKTDRLKNKSTVNVFYENSTRTATSFEAAAKIAGAVSCNMSVANSSVNKGENLIDTVKTLDAMKFDVMVIRHSMAGASALAARHVKASVINAGDGLHEHPTQALLDMLTVKEKFGDFKGLKVAVIGDVKHSRVARSNVWGMSAAGARVYLAGPATLMPADAERLPAKVTGVSEAVSGADVVMGLRLQLERMSGGLIPSVAEYCKFYGLTENLLKTAGAGAVILHPGPINRGVEITSDVADGAASKINEQVTNGLAVRMALLYLLTSGGLE